MVCDIIDQGNDLMGKLAASIQIHFDTHQSGEIAEKFRSLHASVLDFQKKNVGASWPQSFHFWWAEQDSIPVAKNYI